MYDQQHDLEEDKIDMDEMEEDQEAIEIMKSSQYSNSNNNANANSSNHNYMMKGGGSKLQQQHGSLGSSPQPRRNTTNQASRMMDHH